MSVVALALLTLGSWYAILAGSLPDDSVWTFLIGWLVMMSAMMLPAAMPMILVVRLTSSSDGSGDGRTALFALGYLVLWAALGVVALLARSALAVLGPTGQIWAAVGVLALAGLYQLSPLKETCLRACRSPMDFVVLHWRSGHYGALRLGVDHALYCVGCCWALMAVVVVAGGMGIGWVATIAVVVFMEKVFPGRTIIPRTIGVAMLTAAALVATWPWLLPIAGTQL